MASDFAVFRMFGQQIKPGGFDLSWIVSDFEVSLSAELDFTGEAKNGEMTAEDFAHHPYVKIPKIFWKWTTKRVLTMEYVPGLIPANDATALKKAGLDPWKVGCMISDMFAEMVFCSGRVHGDPHAGNVYAIMDPETKKERIVLVDHGLYHNVDNTLRRDFCNFVFACVSRNGNVMKTLGERFAGPLHRFFPMVLSPWFVFGSDVKLEDIRAAKQRRIPPGVDLKDIGKFLIGLHDTGGNLLGVLHSMGYIRGILNNLGFPERRRLKSFSYFASIGAARTVDQDAEGRKKMMKENKEIGSEGASFGMATLQVDALALIISILAPIAFILLLLGKRNAIGLALAIFAVLVAYIYQQFIL